MKRLFPIFLSGLILAASTSFAGTFYNPKPEKLKKKGSEAAEKFNRSLGSFYLMLESVEHNKIGVALKHKSDFDEKMQLSLYLFEEVDKLASTDILKFERIDDKQKKAIDRIRSLIKSEITEKKLTELPISWIKRLAKISSATELTENDPKLFANIRILIYEALGVQRIGLDVSEVWNAAIPEKSKK